MRAVWKFVLHPNANVMMPIGTKPLSVHAQGDDICLWAEVETEANHEARRFIVVGTGHQVPQDAGAFLGSAFLDDGRYVFHVFERV
jgi:hypothetical protein